ncbi:hypothetical protein F5X99DRAFT_423135 [Biscogniauxia marginata]|nr:hypothetical protein F5X99DRAFT_423135 [Biscogniauxia marginata]
MADSHGSEGEGEADNPLYDYYDHILADSPDRQSKGKGVAVEELDEPDGFVYYSNKHSPEHANSARRSPKGKEKEVDPSTIVGPHARYLPGCSGGMPKEKQVISNAMMQAYVKMRGPCMGGDEDPLFEWIKLREDLPIRNPAPGHKKDVSRMLDLIDKSLEETNMGGDSPRDAVFEIERPQVEHINVPEDMDISIHKLTACCADFEFEDDDEDDEEGDVAGGRISPCTFLAWSKGCAQWDDTAVKIPPDVIDTTSQRQRPPTPEVPRTPKDHYPYYYNDYEAQSDEDDGEPLTPVYQVPTSPSIIYTPPGVDPIDFQPPEFQAQYTRMAPLAVWELRRHQFGAPRQDVQPAGEDERYTWAEIEAIAQEPQDFGATLGTFRGADLGPYAAAQWAAAAANEAAEARLHAETWDQRHRIVALERDRALLLGLYVPALRRQRAWRAERARRARAAEHMVRHQAEAQIRVNASFYRLCRTRARLDAAAARADALRDEVDALCRTEGMSCPRELYDEVNAVAAGRDNAPAALEEAARWRERGVLRTEFAPTEL